MKGKRGMDLLTQNVIFLVLNLTFITILTIFIVSKAGNAAVLEEMHAKQIALLIDSAKPGMVMHLNMEDAFKKMEKNYPLGDVVKITENVVTVQLREKGGFSYSFFNDVEVSIYPDTSNNKEYVIMILGNETR
jgi:hypothetical protein